MWLLTVEWFGHITIMFVFLSWPLERWLHEWPKHVGGCYVIKLHSYTQVHLLVSSKSLIYPMNARNIEHTKLKTWGLFVFVVPVQTNLSPNPLAFLMKYSHTVANVLSQFMWLVAGLSLRKVGFNARVDHYRMCVWSCPRVTFSLLSPCLCSNKLTFLTSQN